MMSLKNAILAVGLAVGSVHQVNACTCLPQDLCGLFDQAELVVRAIPFTRSGDEISIFSDVLVSYAMTTVELFKGEPIDAQRLTITTASSSAACGVFMELEEEYLIGANRNANGQFQTSICSLFRLWSGVTEEELALLASGCADDDGCDDAAALVPNGCGDTCGGRCGEFQECLFYEEESEYYCTDFCDPDRCADGEVCTLETVQCFRAPCPPIATCQDPCRGACAKFQECLFYENESEYYCTDFCDPDRCADGEMCVLEDVLCVRAPCPPVATCQDEDPCEGTCAEFQDCLFHEDESEYYCADFCDPDRCADGEVCVLENVLCIQAPCPPIATCQDEDPCGGACAEFQECLFYENESEYDCTDFCDPDRCADGEVCTLENVLCIQAPCPPIATCLEDPCGSTCAETQTCVQSLQTLRWFCA